MKNTIGQNVTLTLFGESHGPYVGATLDGVMPGIKVDEAYIASELSKRRPAGKNETARIEQDEFQIISGVFNGLTTGAPLTIIIPNSNVKSKDYDSVKSVARPSHADYVAYEKYLGFNDYRGGGHFSGRITAAIVALGAILKKALEDKNIYIGTHIKQVGKVKDVDFNNHLQEIKTLQNKKFPVINDIEEEVIAEITKATKDGDSIGGILQTAITGLPIGLGDPWFSSVEGLIANACFSIGGVKGIEFGKGFDVVNETGKTFNDELYYENNKVYTRTNNNSGINGGITNSMPVVFNLAIKPTPSISIPQKTIDFVKQENTTISITGRHDPAIIRRIGIVIDNLMAIVIADMLYSKYGCYFLNFEVK